MHYISDPVRKIVAPPRQYYSTIMLLKNVIHCQYNIDMNIIKSRVISHIDNYDLNVSTCNIVVWINIILRICKLYNMN